MTPRALFVPPMTKINTHFNPLQVAQNLEVRRTGEPSSRHHCMEVVVPF
jgi:hypothetical protein